MLPAGIKKEALPPANRLYPGTVASSSLSGCALERQIAGNPRMKLYAASASLDDEEENAQIAELERLVREGALTPTVARRRSRPPVGSGRRPYALRPGEPLVPLSPWHSRRKHSSER